MERYLETALLWGGPLLEAEVKPHGHGRSKAMGLGLGGKGRGEFCKWFWGWGLNRLGLPFRIWGS